MKSLGPAWWGGLLLGLFIGVFVTALVIETNIVTAPYVKFLRGGAAVGAAMTTLIGGWHVRRQRTENEK